MAEQRERNWAGNYTYGAAGLHRPATTAQARELVARGITLKALGTRHSFNGLADTPGEQIALDRFDQRVELDAARGVVTVGAGVRYGELCRQLDQAGYALPNLASLPHISVVGACATATHGSGDGNGCLATSVAALELVTADGELVTLSRERDGAELAGATVGLGGLGLVTRLTLDVVPAFAMRQVVYENLALAQLERHFDTLLGSAYSVSLFTDWRAPRFSQVWLKRRVAGTGSVELAPELFGATLASGQRHPIDGMPVENCTQQLGIAGPWHERLPHFRLEYTPSSGEELQSEYFVPREHAPAALRAIAELGPQLAPQLQISEVRSIAADELWLSPCYGRHSIAIHFTWRKRWSAVQRLLPLIEERLAPLAARPHWGKLFTISPARLQALYERMPDFRALLRRYDPAGKFRNPFLETYILAGG